MPSHHFDYTAQQQGFDWDAAAVIKTIIFVLITFGTAFGNLIVLLAVVLRKKGLQSSTHYLIANLAFAGMYMYLRRNFSMTYDIFELRTYC